MTAFVHAISVALLHFVWQGLAIALLLRFVLAVLRDSSPRLRYAACSIALAVMSALPLITAMVVYRAPELAPQTTSQITSTVESTAPSTALAQFPHWFSALEAWALPIWSVGVLIFAIRLLRSSGHVAKLRRSGEPVDSAFSETAARLAKRMHIDRPVRLLMSAVTDGPSVVGWLQPVILFPPAALINLTPSQLEAVLAHELAHIRRQDYLVNLLQTIVETLLFYQPAIWWVSSRMRNERELCCDDVVVETCGDPIGYARALTQLERERLASPGLAMATTAGPLMYRIQRLTGVEEHRPVSRLSAMLAMSLAIGCFFLNVYWAKAQPQSGTEPEIRKDSIWTDTVRYGDMSREVRALGKMTTASIGVLNFPLTQTRELQPGQRASIAVRSGIIAPGKVTQIGAAGSDTTPVTIQLNVPVAEFVGQDIDGTVHVEDLKDILYVGRPLPDSPNTETTIFKLEPDGKHAVPVKVRLGAASVNTVQILDGLRVGDRIILSDMDKYNGYDRVRLE